MRRQNGRGMYCRAVARTASLAGTQTVFRRPRRARAVATPTASAVVANGCGAMPSVIRPVTKPGRTSISRTPVPCSESARPRAKASWPALADPYTGLALRGRIAAVEDSTMIVPRPCARRCAVTASSVLTCPVKFVATIVAARCTSRSHSACGISTPAAEMTMSRLPCPKR